jgi:hypothetical protein
LDTVELRGHFNPMTATRCGFLSAVRISNSSVRTSVPVIVMIHRPKHSPTFTPERIKELVDRMATLRVLWLTSVKSRLPGGSDKAAGKLPSRVSKSKDWTKNLRD